MRCKRVPSVIFAHLRLGTDLLKMPKPFRHSAASCQRFAPGRHPSTCQVVVTSPQR